jgi:NAD(P)-dependent dehydrogenase (short-subunit alcohol dehydrogenase family)
MKSGLHGTQRVPSGRCRRPARSCGQPEDLAEAIVFLVSPRASYVTPSAHVRRKFLQRELIVVYFAGRNLMP